MVRLDKVEIFLLRIVRRGLPVRTQQRTGLSRRSDSADLTAPAMLTNSLRALLQALDGKSQLAEYPDGASLAALKVTRRQTMAGGEFVSGAEDCLVRVAALVPDKLIAPARAVAMLGEELLGAQPVVISQRGQYIFATDLIPRDQFVHLSFGSFCLLRTAGAVATRALGWYLSISWSAISSRFLPM